MNRRFPWIKYLVGIALFALWHQLHDIFPTTWAAILATLITYTGFTFHPPHHGFFTI